MENIKVVSIAANTTVKALEPNAARKGFKVINDISPAVAVSVRPYKAVDTANAAEVQRIAFVGTLASGTFKLGFGNSFTTALAYNAAAAAIQTALRLLPGFAGVTVARTGSGPIDVTFAGIYPAPQLIVKDSTLKSSGVSSGQTVGFSAVPGSGTFMLRQRVPDIGNVIRFVDTMPLAYNVTDTDLQKILALAFGDSSLTVDGDFTDGFEISFAPGKMLELEVVNNSLQTANVTASSQIQADAPVFAGQFKLQVNGVKTGFLQYNTTAALVKAAIVALGYPDVDVTLIGDDSISGGYIVEFNGFKGPVVVLATDNTLNDSGTPVDVAVTGVAVGQVKAPITTSVEIFSEGTDAAECTTSVSITTPGTSIAAAFQVAASATLDESGSDMVGPLFLRAASDGQVKIVEVF